MHIGKAIKNIRVLAGLNQSQLAVAIGKTTALVSQIERSGKVNYYTLVLIAKALKTSPEKIELYKNSLDVTVKTTDGVLGGKEVLPEFELIRLENRLLKEHITMLSDQVSQLKKIVSLLELSTKSKDVVVFG